MAWRFGITDRDEPSASPASPRGLSHPLRRRYASLPPFVGRAFRRRPGGCGKAGHRVDASPDVCQGRVDAGTVERPTPPQRGWARRGRWFQRLPVRAPRFGAVSRTGYRRVRAVERSSRSGNNGSSKGVPAREPARGAGYPHRGRTSRRLDPGRALGVGVSAPRPKVGRQVGSMGPAMPARSGTPEVFTPAVSVAPPAVDG